MPEEELVPRRYTDALDDALAALWQEQGEAAAALEPSLDASRAPGTADFLDPVFTLLRSQSVIIPLINGTGFDLFEGDVVMVDYNQDGQVARYNANTEPVMFVAAASSIPAKQIGTFAQFGLARVKTSGTVAVGDFLRKERKAGNKVESLRVSPASVRRFPRGALAVAVNGNQAGAVGYVTAFMFGGFAPEADTSLECEWVEDFLSCDDGADTAGAAKNERWGHVWKRLGNSAAAGSHAYGVCRLTGDSSSTTSELSLRLPGGGFAKTIKADAGVRLECRWAQKGTGAGTRRIGLASAVLTTDPTDGLYFRHSVGGNIIAVRRAASVETTLDTGVAASDGVFKTGVISAMGSSSSVVFVDNVLLGTLGGSLGVELGPSAAGGATAAADGMDVDAIRTYQIRGPIGEG